MLQMLVKPTTSLGYVLMITNTMLKKIVKDSRASQVGVAT